MPTKDSCFMLRKPTGFGGNKAFEKSRFFYNGDGNTPISILDQTSWDVWYVDFSHADIKPKAGTDLFNCSMVSRPDGDWLLARRSEWRHGIPFGMNDVVAYRLDLETPEGGTPLQFKSLYPDEHFEDPRAIYHDGKTWVSCCNFIWAPRFSGPHQVLQALDNDWNAISRHDIVFGRNGHDMYANKGWEKNWLWFFHDDEPHLLYESNPFTVARFDLSFTQKQVYRTRGASWKYGEIRGGTPPVRIGDEYWSFFHSSVDFVPRRNKLYRMGVYAYSAEPPFALTRLSKTPLLSASPYDRCSQDKPLVVFPCGALLRDGEWTISMGVNDLDCAMIRIPHSDVEIMAEPMI